MGTLDGQVIVIYARFSSANQRDTSIDDQVHLCTRKLAELGGVDPPVILSDYSVSGASIARAGFDKLYAMVRAKPRQADVIIVESADRISRDIGDADRFFKEVAFAGIRLICVSDGIDSTQKGARLAYNIKAVFADYFLEDLREKTMRGLQGSARRDSSTGGLPYGYTSRPVWGENRRKPERVDILIDPISSLVVIRIFEMYRDGYSTVMIATILNEDGVAPPRATSKHRKHGWVDTTIREMLCNPKYTGKWNYNKRQWIKVPGTNRRVPRRRPDEQHIPRDRPDLRLIDDVLWSAVQGRKQGVARKYKKRDDEGPKRPGRRASYPFSGLLFCACCKGPMVIVGGGSTRYYRCGDAHKRGTCKNRLPIREDVISTALFDELRDLLTCRKGIEHARESLVHDIAEMTRRRGKDEERIAGQLRTAEAEVERTLDFIAKNDLDDATRLAVRDRLQKQNGQVELLRRQLEGLRTRAEEPIPLPSPDAVESAVFDIERLLRSDPTKAREALGRMLKDSTIELEPQADGTYIARGTVFPLMPLLLRPLERPKPQGREAEGLQIVYRSSCAGRI